MMSSALYPVLEIVPNLKRTLSENRVAVLQAPPGAGKSTVLPIHLMDEHWLGGKKIIMLEPRRLAARSVAMRMSALMEEEVGRKIGYRVRFEQRVSAETKIEVVTEGILTRMIQTDNSLDDAGLLIFDEFHERSLHADLALALALQVQQILRPDLRILIMSATLESDKISTLLDAPVVSSQGRQFPVDIIYEKPDNAPLHLQVAKTVKRALSRDNGDILVFLPGAGEIIRTAALLEAEGGVAIHPLYGDLSFSKQQEAISPRPNGPRRVVLATSIAETSLTIERISVVVDSGYSRVPRFDPRSGLTKLETVRVTRDAADQRAGRAGRLGPGKCYRLWNSAVQATLIPHRVPEILEADLAPLLLELLQWGIKNVSDLKWTTPPPSGSIAQASDLLSSLGAVANGVITDRGRKMLKMPTHPRIAHMLVEVMTDADDSIKSLACDVAALLEERDVLSRDSGADLSIRTDALRRWRSGDRVEAERSALERVERLAASWRRLMGLREASVERPDDAALGKLVIEAYPERVARQLERHGSRYKLSNGRIARLPEHDPLLREEWLAVAHLDAGSTEGKIFLAAALDEQDIAHISKESYNVYWDEDREMVIAALERRVGGLLFSSQRKTSIPEGERISVLCSTIRRFGLQWLEWEERLATWQARVMSLRKWRPEEGWPDVSGEALVDSLEVWLSPFLTDVYKKSDLGKLDPEAILPTILPWEKQARLQSLAPTSLLVPSGSRIRLIYSPEGEPPVMEVRLQEVFGLIETPTVNEGKTGIRMHLLSPGFKPVQVTQDLKSFWTNTYAEVRKELRARYPKHSWPEDPSTAQAVRGVKRKL